jgi:hypothetical protein
MNKIKLKQTNEDFSLYEVNKIRLSVFPITFLVVLSLVILLIYSVFFVPRI